jgi:hypothetical protein
MNSNNISIGDLVKLKGFKLQEPSEVPYGLVDDASRSYCHVQWINANIAERYALKPWIEITKLEIIHKANQTP